MSEGRSAKRFLPGLITLALLVLAVFCWRLAWNAAHTLDASPETTSFRYIQGVAAKDYPAMMEEEQRALSPTAFTLWEQKEGEWATSTELGRGASTSVLEIRGSSRLLFPSSAVLDEEDFSGCLIGVGLSRALFGDSGAIGAELDWNGKIYTVRGVLDSPETTLLVQAAPAGETAMTNLSVAGKGQDFLLRHGLSSALEVSDRLYSQAGKLLVLVAELAAILLSAALLAGVARRWKGYTARGIVVWALWWVVVTAGLLYLLSSVPVELLPSRWSDFAVWRTNLDSWKSYLASWWAAPKPGPDTYRTGLVLRCLWSIPAAGLLLAAFLRLRSMVLPPKDN